MDWQFDPLSPMRLGWWGCAGLPVHFVARVSYLEVYGTHQNCYLILVIDLEELVGAEWAEWYRLTAVQRWLESEKLWQTYLALGGSLDPEPDSQSPFYDGSAPGPRPVDGRPGVRVLRRRGV